MFDGLVMFGNAVVGYLNPLSLTLAFGATLLGVVAGCMPGLTATLVVTLMTTLTIKMPSNQALLVLICTYVGAIYGGVALGDPAQHSRHARIRRRRASTATRSPSRATPVARWASRRRARCSAR